MTRGSDPVLMSRDAWGRTRRGVVTAEALGRSMTPQRRRGGWVPTPPPIEGRVTASAVHSGAGVTTVYSYSWEEIVQTAVGAGNLAAKTNGRTGTNDAFNRWEEINPAAAGDTNPIGMGVYPADITGVVTGTLGPVPNGTPIQLTPVVFDVDGTTTVIYRFNGPNTLRVACA